MLRVVEMPRQMEASRLIAATVPLRVFNYNNAPVWIGQAGSGEGHLERIDHQHCFHIFKILERSIAAYCRLSPVYLEDSAKSAAIDLVDLAKVSGRVPAMEVRHLCLPLQPSNASHVRRVIFLREVLQAAFDLLEQTASRFIFTTSDAAGIQLLRQSGVRFSTLSDWRAFEGRSVKVLCLHNPKVHDSDLRRFRVVEASAPSSSVVL